MKLSRILQALALASLIASGTASADIFGTAVGGGVGAVAGAVIGDRIGGRNGAIIGGGVGGAVGAVVGQSVSGGPGYSPPARYPRVEQRVVYHHYYPAPYEYRGHPGRGHAWGHHKHERYHHHYRD